MCQIISAAVIICCQPHHLTSTSLFLCLRHCHRKITPPPRFGQACKSIWVAPRPPNEADTTTTANPAATNLSAHHCASRDASIIAAAIWGWGWGGLNALLLNLAPSRNEISSTSSCSFPSPSYLHCFPVLFSLFSLLLFRSHCLRIYIRSVITLGPKHETETATAISWQEDHRIPLPPLSLLLPPLIWPVNIFTSILCRLCTYLICPVPVVFFFPSSPHLHLSIFFRNFCPRQKNHISSAAPHHHHLHLPISLSRLPLLSHISSGTFVHCHLCHFPYLMYLLSPVSATVFVILPRFYCSLHCIVLHLTTLFSAIVVLRLWFVSISVISAIPASLPPLSSLNLPYPLPLELSPAPPLPSFLPHFYCPIYFTASTSHHLISFHSASAAAVSVIPLLHQTSDFVYTAALYFTLSLTHHNCTSNIIFYITKQ